MAGIVVVDVVGILAGTMGGWRGITMRWWTENAGCVQRQKMHWAGTADGVFGAGDAKLGNGRRAPISPPVRKMKNFRKYL
jgi:hypothetical protein